MQNNGNVENIEEEFIPSELQPVDHFAGLAMQAHLYILHDELVKGSQPFTPTKEELEQLHRRIARTSFDLADAMIDERSVRGYDRFFLGQNESDSEGAEGVDGEELR